MRGNDIVDLHAAALESNWQRKGFLEKIVTPSEQQYIHLSGNPHSTFWRLWSMKESAYKADVRLTHARIFAPQKYICQFSDEINGIVYTGNRVYRCITSQTTGYIYSRAAPMNFTEDPFLDHCFAITGNTGFQQQVIHQTILDAYAAWSGRKKTLLHIVKDALNIPSLFCAENQSWVPLSITHHGRYAAFTIN